MHWDRLFEDLESQLASEWEAERAALDAEAHRLRISRLDLRARLRLVLAAERAISVELADGSRLAAHLRGIGADWLALESEERRMIGVVPLDAVRALGMDHGTLLRSLEDTPVDPSVRERMTLGFVLRDLARRRIPVQLSLYDGSTLQGTIDRAGADHLDIALHDLAEPRRASAVRGFRLVPFDSLVWVGARDADARLLG